METHLVMQKVELEVAWRQTTPLTFPYPVVETRVERTVAIGFADARSVLQPDDTAADAVLSTAGVQFWEQAPRRKLLN